MGSCYQELTIAAPKACRRFALQQSSINELAMPEAFRAVVGRLIATVAAGWLSR